MKYCSKVTDILGDLHICMKYIKVLILFFFRVFSRAFLTKKSNYRVDKMSASNQIYIKIVSKG